MTDINLDGDTHRRLIAESDAVGEAHDCVVRAIAAVTGESYQSVRFMCAERGRRNGRGMNKADYMPILRDLGYTYANIQPLTGGKTKTGITATRWLQKNAPADARFLIRVRGHLMAWVDGALVGYAHEIDRRRCSRIYLVHRDPARSVLG